MARRRAKTSPRPRPELSLATAAEPGAGSEPVGPLLTRPRLVLIVALLIVTQWSLAVRSLLLENATVDEVVHLPAGVSYWERGDFRLYPHNPPLIKLLAALPVLAADPETDPLYRAPSWGWADANKAAFAHGFMLLNAPRLMELMTLARLIIPSFAVLGGLVVFDWSRRLWGPWGALISLTLWAFCPNILAHSRLVTTDAAATAIGVTATYAFWHYLRRPTWRRVLVAGLLLGIAQLTKFSLLLLLGLWPLLWLIEELSQLGKAGRQRSIGRSLVQGVTMVAVCVLVINIGYGFKGIGKPLGAFDFTCDTLTDDRTPPVPAYKDDPDFRSLDLKAGVLQFRVNRFRDTPLGALPVPLPEPYVLGFDDQKLEAEGVPVRAMMLVDDPRGQGISRYEISGYPVYLDGERRNRSWWYYYIMTLVYKVPEGTWLLVMLSIAVLPAARRARSAPVDEAALWVVPAVVVLVMSFGTNIAIGLRYVLGIFPYLFIAAGRLAPWAMGLQRRGVKALGIALIASALTATVSASLLIHPHYIAYFNWASGGPARGSEHLIDSNLDWGQDLVGLRRWLDENTPGERVGIAYFGQINPETFNLESQASGGPRVLDWFLPPVRPGTLPERPAQASGPPEPGLYAVSASLTRGLPWRIYVPDRWAPLSAKSATDRAGNEYGAFDYFAGLEPIGHVGYSIFLYRIDAEDAKRLARFWQGATVAP